VGGLGRLYNGTCETGVRLKSVSQTHRRTPKRQYNRLVVYTALMPALPPVPNVIRVILDWDYSADTSVSTKHYFEYAGTSPNGATCLAIATAIYNGAVTDLIPLCSTAIALTGCRVTDLSSSSGGDATYVHSTAGSRSGSAFPATIAALVNLSISRRYRGGKPRKYYPFGSVGDEASSVAWSGTFATAVNAGRAAWVAVVSAISSSGTTVGAECNVSYYEGFMAAENPVTGRWRNIPKQRTTPVVDTVTSAALNLKYGSQRRRALHSS